MHLCRGLNVVVGSAASFIAGLALVAGNGCRPASPEAAPSPALVEAMNRGVSLMGQYQYDAAVKAFEQALRAAPDSTEAKINLAIARFNRAQREQQDLEQGQALLEAVIQQEPDHPRALYFKGILLQHLGQTEAAIPCFEKVVRQHPSDGVAWYLLGLCQQRAGQNAEPALRRALELRPYLVSAHYQLWQVLQAAGRTNEAAAVLERFKQLRESPLGETVELPQYGQMGNLALALPLPAQRGPSPDRFGYRAGAARVIVPESEGGPAPARDTNALPVGGAAWGDADGDGRLDLFLAGGLTDLPHVPFAWRGQPDGSFAPAPAHWGLAGLGAAQSCALGDFDNDEVLDLFVVGAGSNYLFRGLTNGLFTNVTAWAGILAPAGRSRSALWLDADHDGDLDLFVCNSGGPNQLFRNNADGTFTNIADRAGVAVPDGTSVAILPGDVDGDRDMDLVVLRTGAPAKVFLNDLLGQFTEAALGNLDPRGDLGGVLQDFNGDGTLDLLVLGGPRPDLQLYLGDGTGHFQASNTIRGNSSTVRLQEPIRSLRAVDVDLDGDLDIALFGITQGHILRNDGTGWFVPQPGVWTVPLGVELAGVELADVTGDFVPDLLVLERGLVNRVRLMPGELTPPSASLALQPTGVRSRDKRTRSPASGYGTTLTVRAGLREQRVVYTGLAGGLNQSALCVTLGLGGAREADYVHLLWPDGVAQVEVALRANQPCQKLAELQRKVSSCPVLFAWNGARFACVTDFAGVGGLGYFVAPGEYAPARPLEHIKIEPDQLRPRDGAYELRITEPMEESAYVDRLELRVVDHPPGSQVFPDERLNVTGPPPTHDLLVVHQPVFPRLALDPAGRDCTDRLLRVDREYAYHPELDRRFFGFCQPHSLELDFDDALAGAPTNRRVFLFVSGYLEYPYSQTTYAAHQARLGWEPIRIEGRQPDGRWITLVPDAGAFGGLARTMTVELTGRLPGRRCQLRLTSNLEIFYDQVFLAPVAGPDQVRVHALPVAEAELRRLGFPREYSPDGRLPLVYDYDLRDASAPFHVLRGAYTRYGPVRELLTEADDQYALLAPGDELAVRFDAAGLPALPAGWQRSFVLVAHAWCKDSDLYTATPQTLEPLPFHGMSRYPYPENERYPDTAAHRRYRQTYNTRLLE